MSGPKVQIYKLKGKERENALAQLRCDREAARYFNASKEMLKKLSDSEAEIRISLQILKRMHRLGTREDILRCIHGAKSRGLTIRTTVMTGFPGENRGTVPGTAAVCSGSGV